MSDIEKLLTTELLYVGNSPTTRKAFQAALGEIHRLKGIVDVMRTDCIYAEDQWAKTKLDLDERDRRLERLGYPMPSIDKERT